MLASELAQKTTELALRIVGVDAAGATPPQAVYDHLMSRCFTIAGGTSEISRNVIAERLLGLPREDRRDQ
jgi:alkylation response protein AidB-like acyl-CoA dehydrogenase